MNVLVAVKSHQGALDHHQVIRDTWGQSLMDWFHLRFFVGSDEPVNGAPDEVFLPCRDDYRGLSHKVNSILDWTTKRKYDSIVIVDTDTFINGYELAKLPWGTFDYAGFFLSFKNPFMFGGCGFALSADAAHIVLNNNIQHDMDDISIGEILLHRPQPDIRILPCQWHRRVGWHFPKNTYAAQRYRPDFPWMKLMANRHLGQHHGVERWNTYIGGAVRTVEIPLCREDRETL